MNVPLSLEAGRYQLDHDHLHLPNSNFEPEPCQGHAAGVLARAPAAAHLTMTVTMAMFGTGRPACRQVIDLLQCPPLAMHVVPWTLGQ